MKRATQTVPPAVRRFVLRRDGMKCRVPGCRCGVFLQLHHVFLVSEGGKHDPRYMLAVCDRHHDAVHRGALHILADGKGGFRFFHADGSTYGLPSGVESLSAAQELFATLRAQGFSDMAAREAVLVQSRPS